MTCQHILYSSEDSKARFQSNGSQPVRFEPIVDTFEHRILGRQCVSPFPGSAILAIRSAAKQVGGGICFVDLEPSSIDDPELDLTSTVAAVFDSGLAPSRLVFGMTECDLARDPTHSHVIRDYLRRRGLGFALTSAGLGAGSWSFQAASDFAPNYLKLDPRLVRNFDQPASAPAIGRLVQIADRSGTCVVAEGVDRIRVVENLWLLGIRFMQGQLFGECA